MKNTVIIIISFVILFGCKNSGQLDQEDKIVEESSLGQDMVADSYISFNLFDKFTVDIPSGYVEIHEKRLLYEKDSIEIYLRITENQRFGTLLPKMTMEYPDTTEMDKNTFVDEIRVIDNVEIRYTLIKDDVKSKIQAYLWIPIDDEFISVNLSGPEYQKDKIEFIANTFINSMRKI